MANAMHIGTSAGSLTDLSGSTYGLTVTRGARPAMAEAQFEGVALPGVDGGVQFSTQFGLRKFTIDGFIQGDSYDDAQTKLDALMAVLNPQIGDQYLKLDTEDDRLWLGRVCGAVQKERRGMSGIRVSIPWQCSRATAYATSETTRTVTVNSDPEAWDEPSAGSVSGSAYAEPVWVVKNTSGADSDPLFFENTTTGEQVSTTEVLANGEWARFDCARQIIEKSTDSGANWSAWMTARGSYRNIPRLKPAVSNHLVLTGLSAGSVVCTYRARYL